MPGGDGTGPMGMGPMTGRGAGYCAGNAMPGYTTPFGGRGFRGAGWGRGGRGRRNRFYATGLTGWQRASMGVPAFGGGPAFAAPYGAGFVPGVAKEQQLDALKGQAEYFADALEGIRQRIEELEKSAAEA